jgi:mannose-6-phosphate isomerase-like protein (cupin superfamily)
VRNYKQVKNQNMEKINFNFRKGLIDCFSIVLVCVLVISCKDHQEQKDESGQQISSDSSLTHGSIEYHGSVIMKPDEGDVIWLKPQSKDTLGSGVELHIYMDSKNHPNVKSSFAKVTVGEGGNLPAHKHEKTEEIAYILSGEGYAINYINDEYKEIPIKEGYVWYNPPGIWHTFKNTGDDPLTLIMAVLPNEKQGLLSFFRKVGAKPGELPSTFTAEEFKELAKKHDMTLMPPKNVEK